MKVEKVGRSAPEIKDIVAATRLSPLIAYSLDTGDKGLISVLRRGDIRKLVVSIFRYQRPLSPLMMWHHTFHTFDALHVDQVVDLLVDLLEVSSQEARDETFQWGHMFGYPGCKTFIVANVTQDSGLFVCWIYEHFSTIASYIAAKDYHERKPQKIGDKWMHFSEYLAPVGQICVAPRQCVKHYMEWFYMISHLFMSPTQPGDPLRHPPMEACHAITERLECLINLRVVTKGTKTYNVTKECLRIAKGAIAQGNVYVRSRRRLCTLDA
ncbi:hypothetical protein GmHk_18G052134 [Glycine max]|nr:hypothetical protein GmHk_18G052134 [Glycine max]